ncbi:PAS domain-containing protein [Archangium violaceum]|nr:PAS domain-containing protein [Archangium violaceum]
MLESTEAVDSVSLLMREGDVLRVRASVGLEEEVTSGFRLRVGEGFSGRIAAEQRPLELRSAATDPLVRSELIRSRGTRALYGVPLMYGEEVIGVAHMGSRTACRHVNEVVPGSGPALEPVLRRVLETGEASRGQEFSAAPANDPGVIHHWVGDYFPVRGGDGRVLGVGSVVMDITERKQQEELMRQTAEFRERFLGVVSHDLRNPLNAILLSANTLLRLEGIPATHAKVVRRIVTSGERMARMIGELLDFTRGRLGGGIPSHPRPTNLRHLCRHVLEELETSHPGRDLRLVADGRFLGEWDPDRLAQLLGNLGKNALDYSPAETPVDFTLQDEGDTVTVVVHNEGRPIPRKLLTGIFEPFRRAVEGDAHPTSGLGLGLFIVQQIAEAHGGSVEVRSHEGDGTTFTVRLPRHSAGSTWPRSPRPS